MSWLVRSLAPFLVVAVLFGQDSAHQTSHPPRVIWSPPNLKLPSMLPTPSVKKEIIKGLRIDGWPVTLEKTKLAQAQKQFGAVVGSRGDASEALAWICLQGIDDQGTWVMWLYSGEINGPAIGGFQWQRISPDMQLDRRCRLLDRQQGRVELPIHLTLGMSEAEVVARLGRPSGTFRNLAIYSHEHNLTIDNEPYTVENDVLIEYGDGKVSTIAVNHTTSN
jgi:hypothetical protein